MKFGDKWKNLVLLVVTIYLGVCTETCQLRHSKSRMLSSNDDECRE